MIWLVRVLGGFLLAVTVLPMFSTGRWYVRWWDFPRVQVAILLLVNLMLGGILLAAGISPVENAVWLSLQVVALLWQLSHIAPFLPGWPMELASSDDRHTTPTYRLLMSNLKVDNPQIEKVPTELGQQDADILMLIEVDDRWLAELNDLRGQYHYHFDHPRDEGLGMCVWSRRPIQNVQVKHLVSDRRASIWGQVELDKGRWVNFVFVHPTPPGLDDSTGKERRDSRVRDAELIIVAREIANNPDQPWLVAGDFNDVAWSHTTRLFKRISGLRDPRVGRSLMGTFMAPYPPCRCPIDHIFLSDGFLVDSLTRHRISGSDHFAIGAEICLKAVQGADPDIGSTDRQDAQQILEQGRKDAQQRQVDANSASP